MIESATPPPDKYRLYVDEVGNHDLDSSENESERYLSLTGLMFELDYVKTTVAPGLETLKARYFGSHPDDPVVLHRKDLANRRPPFQALRDRFDAALFDADLLKMLRDLDYVALTVVIDKKAHKDRYRTWAVHPYHYGMQVLLERFVLELGSRGAVGDVMAEARGTKARARGSRSSPHE